MCEVQCTRKLFYQRLNFNFKRQFLSRKEKSSISMMSQFKSNQDNKDCKIKLAQTSNNKNENNRISEAKNLFLIKSFKNKKMKININ